MSVSTLIIQTGTQDADVRELRLLRHCFETTLRETEIHAPMAHNIREETFASVVHTSLMSALWFTVDHTSLMAHTSLIPVPTHTSHIPGSLFS